MKKRKKDFFALQKRMKDFEYQGNFTAPGVEKEDFFKGEKIYKVDKDFKYIDNSIKYKFVSWCIFRLKNFASLFVAFYYGLRIKGKENLKGLKSKGAITISNHFMYLDNMLIDRIFFCKSRVYFIVAAKNNIKGPLGYLMRRGGIIPIGSTLRAKINFMRAIKTRVQQNYKVHVYAEEEMWLHYRKPRPLNEGAFQLAMDNNVPVIPIFFAYRENGKFREYMHLKNKITAYILPPVYADMNLSSHEAIHKMRHDVEKMQREYYEKHYNLVGTRLYEISDEGKEKLKGHEALLD